LAQRERLEDYWDKGRMERLQAKWSAMGEDEGRDDADWMEPEWIKSHSGKSCESMGHALHQL